MDLFALIKSIRQQLGMNAVEFARKIEVTPTYVAIIEKPPKKGQRLIVPSVEILRRIARIASQNPEERKALERKLFIERAKLLTPELKSYYDEQIEKEKIYTMQMGMPAAFITRLKEDIKKTGLPIKVLCNAVGLTEEQLRAVLEGRICVNWSIVISLALSLDQTVDDYLLLANYIPETMRRVTVENKDRIFVFFQRLAELSNSDVAKIIDAFNSILNVIEEKSQHTEER